MGEFSTGIKLGITLVIIAFVIAIIFFIFSMSSVLATSTLNDTLQNMENAKVSIEDLRDKEFPMISFKALLKDYIVEGYITSVSVTTADSTHTTTYPIDDKTLNDAWVDYAESTGHITSYTYDVTDPSNPTGVLEVKLGG